MEHIKKIMVGIDSSFMDKTIIPYTKFICDIFPVEKLYIVNAIKHLNIPDELLKEYPDFISQTIEERRKDIKEDIEKAITREGLEIEYIIKQGNPTKMIMELSEKEKVDLILIGRKITIPSSSSTGPRLARRANCNLMIIPEGVKPKLKKMLVPLDYSEHSKQAFHYAVDLARELGESTSIITQNVYTIPAGWHYTGKTKEEFNKIMKKNSENSYNHFLKEFDTKGVKIKSFFHLDDNDDLTSDILRVTQDKRPDWIIIGAKGRTAATALFIGSFAEKLISTITHVPIFIARPKGKNAGILDYIKEI